jgi:hypothetical protein
MTGQKEQTSPDANSPGFLTRDWKKQVDGKQAGHIQVITSLPQAQHVISPRSTEQEFLLTSHPIDVLSGFYRGQSDTKG